MDRERGCYFSWHHNRDERGGWSISPPPGIKMKGIEATRGSPPGIELKINKGGTSSPGVEMEMNKVTRGRGVNLPSLKWRHFPCSWR